MKNDAERERRRLGVLALRFVAMRGVRRNRNCVGDGECDVRDTRWKRAAGCEGSAVKGSRGIVRGLGDREFGVANGVAEM